MYGDKALLKTLRIKLAASTNDESIGGATGLNTNLRVIVDPNGSSNTTPAGINSGEVQADNLIVLSSNVNPSFTPISTE